MELYFTRHGRTEWNKEKRLQGSNGDSPLLPESRKQIAAFGRYLAKVPFEKIYVSPAKRAIDTAKIFKQASKCAAPLIITPALKEIGLGRLEGEYIKEAQAAFPQEMENLRHHPDRYDPKIFGGEPFPHAIARTTRCVLEAYHQAQHGPLLFVGHGASLTACVQTLVGTALADTRKMGGLKNNSLTIVQAETSAPPFRLVEWNELPFLKGGRAFESGDDLI